MVEEAAGETRMDPKMTEYELEHIDIEVNHRCNLACRHCSARAGKSTNPRELTTQQIQEILARSAPLGLRKVGLTGGEPLIDVPKLARVAAFCLEGLQIPIHMHTNGTLVTENLCRSGGVLTLFESVSITFLGGDARTHDWMTTVHGSFEGSLQGVKTCVAFGLPLTCYFIPTHGTCNGFFGLADQLARLGVRRLRAMALAPSGRARPIYGKTAPRAEEVRTFEEHLLEVSGKFGIHVEAGHCTRLSMPRLEVLSGHDRCMSGINRLHIISNGDVFPCTAASGVKELKAGNVLRSGLDIARIWRRSSRLAHMRAMHEGKLASCGHCPQRQKCRHGCTVNACGTMTEDERALCDLFGRKSARHARGHSHAF
jgi:radical SAM protein with 4Fe4S-binding SPASM domain